MMTEEKRIVITVKVDGENGEFCSESCIPLFAECKSRVPIYHCVNKERRKRCQECLDGEIKDD